MNSQYDDGEYTIEDTIEHVANVLDTQLRKLGLNDASTSMGAIEAHADIIGKGLDAVAQAINYLAQTIESIGEFGIKVKVEKN